ncbi:MAG: O-antigen ligase family protein [Clostridiales bacterium]|nr:O-antigen ligase family protein [Clostridiales bacterium]
MAIACLLGLGYFFSVFAAVDRGIALLGFFRIFAIFAFVLLLYQRSYAFEKANIWEVIPLSGAFSVVLALLDMGLSLFTHKLLFFQNGRLGCVMGYANTYALWLLLGLLILAFRDKPNKLDYCLFALNICGILLTISRSMFLLTAVFLVLLFLLRKSARRMILSASLFSLLAGLLMSAALGVGEWSRIAQLPNQAGEWLSRLVYYRDALSQIILHPWGRGYLGYWYTQPIWQTAFYEVRFVHSSLLQYALDIGITPALILLGLGVFIVIRRKTPLMEKLILLLILGHSLIDIDLEFLVLIFIVCLCIKPDQPAAIPSRLPAMILLLLTLPLAYLSVAAFDAERREGGLAINMYPAYTEAWEKQLMIAPTLDQAAIYAQRLLEGNPYNFVAIDTLARVCYRDNNFELAAILKLKSLDINRMFAEDYLELLDICAAGYNNELNSGNEQGVAYFRQILLSIPQRIQAVRDSLNADAYKLNHTPQLEIPDAASDYIESLRQHENQN